MNEEIRAREVRLVDTDGTQVGIVPLSEALRLAEERGLDLVEVAPQARPPVCKIMDYGKFRYEMSKKDREARKKQHLVAIKEVKFRPNIEEHDFQVKARNVIRFLEDGDKVKVTIMFRGREIIHPQLGERLLDRLKEEAAEVGMVERAPKLEGRNMIMILAPKSGRGVKKEEIAED
ncbi:translation initiation factor IF-3 [Desulfothermobacter acidiphilus]|uniref:translation initiation factor IF-3 n=1 Tax=Desulfothermobacter acidiphilus TaxID=1938353 RepID=UPI003F8B1DAF